MKKILFTVFFLLICSLSFAEELTGFMGIPFGASKGEAINTIESKGYELAYADKTNYTYVNDNGKYLALNAQTVILTFSKDNLFAGGTFITTLNNDTQNYVIFLCDVLNSLFELSFVEKTEGENMTLLFYVTPNGNKVIYTLAPGITSITFGIAE